MKDSNNKFEASRHRPGDNDYLTDTKNVRLTTLLILSGAGTMTAVIEALPCEPLFPIMQAFKRPLPLPLI
jgi:hypothetical protein